jgi:hypothetical protein
VGALAADMASARGLETSGLRWMPSKRLRRVLHDKKNSRGHFKVQKPGLTGPRRENQAAECWRSPSVIRSRTVET